MILKQKCSYPTGYFHSMRVVKWSGDERFQNTRNVKCPFQCEIATKKKKIPPTLTWMPEQFVDHLQLVERSERSAVSGWNRAVNKIHFSKIENYSNHPEFVPLMCEHMLYLTHRQPSAVKKKKKGITISERLLSGVPPYSVTTVKWDHRGALDVSCRGGYPSKEFYVWGTVAAGFKQSFF